VADILLIVLGIVGMWMICIDRRFKCSYCDKKIDPTMIDLHYNMCINKWVRERGLSHIFDVGYGGELIPRNEPLAIREWRRLRALVGNLK